MKTKEWSIYSYIICMVKFHMSFRRKLLIGNDKHEPLFRPLSLLVALITSQRSKLHYPMSVKNVLKQK